MIYHCDVVEGLRKLESNSVDCIILDPPYNIGKDYGNNRTKLEMDDYVSWAQTWLAECERVLKPNGTMIQVIGDVSKPNRGTIPLARDYAKLLFRLWTFYDKQFYISAFILYIFNSM